MNHLGMMRQIATSIALLLLCASTVRAAGPSQNAQIAHDHQAFDEVERGRYLAVVSDCAACHTVPGGKPYAGGRVIETPFGALLAPNLTPDVETGIGAWSDDEFVRAVQDGRGRGGRHLYPAMPYPYYTKMSRADILAIRAYLGALEPVHNPVEANQLPFPFDIRASMSAWNWLFFSSRRFVPTAGKSEEWNRGAYLVEGPAHCGACHTEKNFLGGDKNSQALQGGILQGWYSPDLTGDPRRGLGKWSVEDVVEYMKTGHNRTGAATGPMSEVIAASTSHLTDDDLKAIAVYLKDRPAVPRSAEPLAASNPAMKIGAAIYVDQCQTCHAAAGTGVASLFPAMKDNPEVQAADPTTLIRILLHGAQNVATDAAPTAPSMPAFRWKLTDAQAAAVLTYIRNTWGNAASAVSSEDVSAVRASQLSQAGP